MKLLTLLIMFCIFTFEVQNGLLCLTAAQATEIPSGAPTVGKDSRVSANKPNFLTQVSQVLDASHQRVTSGIGIVQTSYPITPTKCKFTDDMIPEELSVFLQLNCSFPQGPSASQAQYCECVAAQHSKLTNRQDQAKAEEVKKKLEAMVVGHQINKWLKYYKLIVKGQDQLRRQQSGGRGRAFGVIDGCKSDNLADPIADYIRNNPNECNPIVLMPVLKIKGVDFSSKEKAKSSLGEVLRKSAEEKVRRSRDNKPLFNCLQPGEEVMLTHIPLGPDSTGVSTSSEKPSYEDMIKSLEQTLTIVKSRDGKDLNLIRKNQGSHIKTFNLLDPIALSQNLGGEVGLSSALGLKREEVPNFGALSYAIGSFPLFGHLVKSLADDERLRDANGDPLLAFSDEQKAKNRVALIAELQRLIKLYKDLNAIKSKGAKRRISDALLLTAKFLKETQELANRADPDQVASASLALCQSLTQDFLKIACAPMTDISSPSLIANLLSDGSLRSSTGLPDFKECHSPTVDYNNSPNCYYMQSAVCSANNKVAQNGYNINGSFELLPDFNSPDYLKDDETQEDRAIRIACGGYSDWAVKEFCKGKTGDALEECGHSPESLAAYIAAEPTSDLARIRTELDDIKNEDPSVARVIAGSSDYSESSAGVDLYSSDVSRDEFQSIISGGAETYTGAVTDEAETVVDPKAADVLKPQQTRQSQVMDFKPYVVRAQAESNLKKSEADLRRVDEQMRSENDPTKRSELDKERARLEAEIAGFKAQIEESNKQIAEMRREFENRPQATGNQDKKRKVASNDDDEEEVTTTRRRARNSGSSSGGIVVPGNERGGSTAGAATAGATAGSSGGSGGSSGVGGSGPITSVKAAQQAIASNDALLETVNGRAAQLTLTVDGQTVNVQQILSLAVPADASPEDVHKLMVADPSKLVFNGDGYALVEVTRPGQAPAYFKVKKDDLSTVAVSDSNDIPKQVRRWSASYASFMERLKANRAPAGQPNQESP